MNHDADAVPLSRRIRRLALDEHRRDDEVLARRKRPEVDERRPQLERGA